MSPNWLEAVAWAFSRFDDVDMLYGARVVEDETADRHQGQLPRMLLRHFDREQLIEDNFVDTNVIAHRAGLSEARWDPAFEGIEDWEFAIRMTADKPAIALPALAALYRTNGPNRITHSTTNEARETGRATVRARVQRTGR
jgi:hypothetical protein